jgi:outer membrane protein assembly factor BamB
MRSLIVIVAALSLGAGWPTASHDVRRTGQSDVQGPHAANNVVSIVLANEQSVNMPVTIADDGTLFAGTWGMVRSGGAAAGTDWNKFDGKLFAFDRTLASRWTAPLDRTPYCYLFGGRAPTATWCSNAAMGTINGYAGTVEGVAALDASRGRLYAGRGDGKLYATDAATGAVVWRFATFNPVARSDPEGGGEVIAGPLVGANGTIYFGTVAVGSYETNAVYAVAPDGTMLWRYPAATATMAHVVWAPPALSPDGKTLYVGGGWGPTADHWDTTLPGLVYALNAADGKVKWTFSPINEAEWWRPTVWTNRIAVGTDGTIYAAGTEFTLGGGSSVLFALRDEGTRASYAWPHMVDLDLDRAAVPYGLGLREVAGRTTRVYATSGNPFNELQQGYKAGGKLVATDAATGSVLWTFDPEKNGGTGSMTGIAIDAAGVVYTGVSGAKDSGRVYAVREDGTLLWQITLGGLLEWAHPVLGPRGDLYVAETRRCVLNALPVESGVCNAVNTSPRIYAVLNGERRRAAKH